MSDLMQIARSGISAYRTALATTGENIANVDTQGYMRRDASLREVGVGDGVEVADVRRAFDALLADRVRDAGTGLSAAETYLTHMQTLEDRLLPGADGLNRLLDGFFDALDGLSTAPADDGLRHAALGAADALAGGVADLARSLDTMAGGLRDEAAQRVSEANAVMADLAEVQGRLGPLARTGEQNPMLDQRDRLLERLSGLLGVDVQMSDNDLATVRLGQGGPVLVAGDTHARLRLESGDDALRIAVVPPDREDATQIRAPQGGALGGLAQAAGTLDEAMDDLDAWAARMATEINEVHAMGVTQEGRSGAAFFTTSGWDATPGALMRGDATIELTHVAPDEMPNGPLTLIHDATAGLWHLDGPTGLRLASGARELSLPGLSFRLNGTPLDGDRITLERVDGSARHMALALSAPEEIAAAGALGVVPAAGNQGAAVAQVAPAPAPPGSGLPDLSSKLGDAPVEFLTPGVVGVILAGGGAVRLDAQPRLASFELVLPAGAQMDGVRIATASGPVALTAAAPGAPHDIVADLNAGRIAGPSGESLASLGLSARFETDTRTLVVTQKEGFPPPSGVTVETSLGAQGAAQVATPEAAATLLVFTREGRQLSGPPLDPASAAALLTPANGFSAEAEYVPDFAAPPGGRRLDIDGPASVGGMDVPADADLLVVLSGPGALRLDGRVADDVPAWTPPREVRVLDAGTGLVGLFDTASGAHLASRTLDAQGRARLGGVDLTLTGDLATGDRYAIENASGRGGDARGITALADLRQASDATGQGDYGAMFASLQQRIGAQVSAAETRVDTATAERDSADRALSGLAGVDLDAEAARLMQQQQAYQANAQVLSTARDLFDTLLAAI